MNRREFKKRRVKLYQTPEIVQHFLALQFKDFGIDFTAVNSRPVLGQIRERDYDELAWIWRVSEDTFLLCYPGQKEKFSFIRGNAGFNLAISGKIYCERREDDLSMFWAHGKVQRAKDLSFYIEVTHYGLDFKTSPLWTTVRPGETEGKAVVMPISLSRLPLKKRNRHRLDEKKIEAMM